MSKTEDGATRFNRFYESIYQERWPLLKEALLKESTPIALEGDNDPPYYMDEASIIAASYLPVKSDDSLLDMCAAPGGKSLILASKLQNSGHLVCNDRSSTRRSRLHNVLHTYLQPSMVERVSITSHDATKWSLYETNAYDAILLDAPCSSERHVLQKKKALDQWSERRTKMLSIQQFAMLASALEAVKVGGYILYSTCSISPLENQQVVEKLEKKRKDRYEIVTLDDTIGERLSAGTIILPDVKDNLGPLYFCLIRRLG
jgi:16S rRNA C967 or C1407 C5-methylase (RsmB/RsmF family)